MGRGRAKAKQTKVARELKYGGPQTDFDRLQAELAGGSHHSVDAVADEVDEVDDDELEDDPYAKYYDEDDEDEADEQRAG